MKCQEEIKIEKLFQEICSENPPDKLKKRKKFIASIKLQNPNKNFRTAPRKCNMKDVKIFEKEIKELLELGIIIPSKSQHYSLAFYVTKKDTDKKRMVIDYRLINENIIMDGYHIPNKNDLLSYIGGMKYFSSLDCKSEFWQTQLDDETQLITAFSCPQGQYHWTVLQNCIMVLF